MDCEVSREAHKVTARQLEHLVRSRFLGTMPSAHQALFDFVSGSAFWDYIKRYPDRRTLLNAVLDGIAVRTAAQGICQERLARKWADHFFELTASFCNQKFQSDRPSDRDILLSICAMTHGRSSGGASGRERIGATMCPGCTVSAA